MASTAYSTDPISESAHLSVETAQVAPDKGSYGEILKSSALIGGSSVLNIGIGIIRTKVMAMLLGPGGFGLVGVYQSITDLSQNIAEMGVNSSGVRQIAEAAGSGDDERIALTVSVLRRTSLVLGILGAVLLVVLSPQVSSITFGNRGRSGAICLLGFAVLFRIVSAGQGALLQGKRRIADLAKMNVFGAFFATLVSIPVIYVLREKGVALYLVLVALMTLIASWWYSRKVQIPKSRHSLPQVRAEAGSLLKLGVAFMTSAIVIVAVAYVVRVLLLRKVGIESTGLYQSAWTLGGLYVGFILQAMAADFYPRLTANIQDHEVSNRLVNEQARVGLLLAGPGVIATLTLAPLVIAILYSGRFSASVPILRWICLGATMQVITWPVGFIIVAKGKQNLFLFSEITWAVVSVGLAELFISRFGLNGAGIAFFVSYIFHGLLVYPIANHLSGFRFSPDCIRMGLLFLSAIAMVFISFHVLPVAIATSIGVLATALSGIYSIRVLMRLVAFEDLPRPLRRLLALLGTLAARTSPAN